MTESLIGGFPLYERVEALILAWERGTLGDSEMGELDRLVREEPRARRLYAQYVVETVDLRSWAACADLDELSGFLAQAPENREANSPRASDADIVLPSSFASVPGFLPSTLGYSSGWPVAYSIATVVTGLLILGFWLMPLSPPEQLARQSDSLPSSLSSLPSVVGRITGTVDCKWVASKTQDPRPKTLVALGDRLTLASGLMEITYDTGAKVILQGPVTYEVESNGGYLAVGKLTGKLGERGEGSGERGESDIHHSSFIIHHSSNPQSLIPNPFVIRTPTATVTDLGTEFGVKVDRTGVVETCVFDGHVRVAAVGMNNSDGGAGQELSRGEAVRIAPNERKICRASVKPGQYVRQLPRKRVILDNFDVEHDYRTAGVQGTIWSGIVNAHIASRLDTLPVDLGGERQTGVLTMGVPEGAWAGWAQPHRGRTWKNAPYLYVNIPKGDFEARVRIELQTVGQWSAAGLMARQEDGSFVSVHSDQFDSKGCRFATRSNWKDIDTDANDPDLAGADKNITLRLVRMGDTFLASGSIDDGKTWRALDWGKGKNSMGGTVLHLPDMMGPIQVGLWFGTFNRMAGEASFKNFIVERRN